MKPETKQFARIAFAWIACLSTLGVEAGLAQSLGDVARQERARQKHLPRTTRHVYTNDDLERRQILVPEDRARFEADRKDPSQPFAPESSTVTSEATHQREEPLGDVARRYRMLKQLEEILDADKTDVLPGAKPALASPTLTRPRAVPIRDPFQKEPRVTRQPEFQKRPTLFGGEKIRINPGDSLWRLARRRLGNGSLWRKILAVNPQLKDPNLIRAGEWIQMPQKEATSSMASQVRVHKGDTLWKLAQASFGNGLAWSCIARANPMIPNANVIYSGQLLTLPARCTPAP